MEIPSLYPFGVFSMSSTWSPQKDGKWTAALKKTTTGGKGDNLRFWGRVKRESFEQMLREKGRDRESYQPRQHRPRCPPPCSRLFVWTLYSLSFRARPLSAPVSAHLTYSAQYQGSRRTLYWRQSLTAQKRSKGLSRTDKEQRSKRWRMRRRRKTGGCM